MPNLYKLFCAAALRNNGREGKKKPFKTGQGMYQEERIQRCNDTCYGMSCGQMR